MIDVGAGLAAAKKIDEGIGLIGKLIGKLKAQPDLAAQKLSQVLEEIGKTLQAVDQAISVFLSLGIDKDALQKNSKLLLDIEGGGLSTAIERGRGHCHVIGNIYTTHLDRWFEQALKPDEYHIVQGVFAELGNADNDLFHNLARVAGNLEKEARAALDLVVKGDVAMARERILSIRGPMGPLRHSIAKTMQELYRLKGEFIDILGVA